MKDSDYTVQQEKKPALFRFSQMSMKEIGKSFLGILGIAVITVGAIIGLVFGILSITQKNYCYEIFKSKAELNYYASKDDLVNCIDSYIHSIAPESAMNGLAFVNKCDEYNIDVRFAVTQAQIEGAFATKGVAAKTHSAFNVMAYDGRTASDMIKKGHHYKHPDESIEPYLILLRDNYLVDGKTEMDMLDKYVDKNGHRYASSKDYEQTMRSAYKSLTDSTNISILYAEYQKYKMICEK